MDHSDEDTPWSDIDTEQNEYLSKFLQSNWDKWGDLRRERMEADFDQYFLVDARFDRLDLLQKICTVSNYICKAEELTPLYMVPENDETKTAICSSFYPGQFVSLSRGNYRLKDWTSSVCKLVENFPRVRNLKELLEFEIDGIPIGDLIYGTALRNANTGTFDSLNRSLVRYLAAGIVLKEHVESIFRQFDIQGALITSLPSIYNGLVGRVAFHEGSSVYVFQGEFLAQYSSMGEFTVRPKRPERDLFKFVFRNRKEQALDRSSEILEQSHGENPETVKSLIDRGDVPELKDYVSEEPVALDESKPTALILPHVLVEFLHDRQRLFRDYFSWYEQTVKFAAGTPEVNWLIKPHWGRHLYDYEDYEISIVREAMDSNPSNTIHIIEEETPIETLVNTSDAIVTVDGTAGIEFPCYGVRSIIAGRAEYGGFGFTEEPLTRTEYNHTLGNLAELSPLTDSQIERAKTMLHVYFDVLRSGLPRYPPLDDVLKWHDGPESLDPSDWKKAFEYMDKFDPFDDAHYANVREFTHESRRNFVNFELLYSDDNYHEIFHEY